MNILQIFVALTANFTKAHGKIGGVKALLISSKKFPSKKKSVLATIFEIHKRQILTSRTVGASVLFVS